MQFSPSKLNVLNNCPRCFWLENNEKIKRPRGIVAGIMGGMDRKFKVYFDRFRGSMPVDLGDLTRLGYKLYEDMAKLNKWRNWRSGLTCFIDDVKLIGALDDCLVSADGSHLPLDYKTKGSQPKDDGSQYYQTQLDCYQLMLRENGFKVNGKGVLLYYWPEEVEANTVTFGHQFFILDSSADRAIKTIERAVSVLKGKMPDASATCEYCEYERQKMEYLRGRENKTN